MDTLTNYLWLSISLGTLVLRVSGVEMDIVIGNEILSPDGFCRR